MASILFVGTNGSNDPTKAALTFVGAKGAVDAGHKASVALVGEGVWLIRDTVAENVKGVGFAPAKELVEAVVKAGVPIHL